MTFWTDPYKGMLLLLALLQAASWQFPCDTTRNGARRTVFLRSDAVRPNESAAVEKWCAALCCMNTRVTTAAVPSGRQAPTLLTYDGGHVGLCGDKNTSGVLGCAFSSIRGMSMGSQEVGPCSAQIAAASSLHDSCAGSGARPGLLTMTVALLLATGVQHASAGH